MSIYYNSDQNVITKITKERKMSTSDKISWVGGMMGLFTGFSVISGAEILYWIIFKVLLHKPDTEGDLESRLDHPTNMLRLLFQS